MKIKTPKYSRASDLLTGLCVTPSKPRPVFVKAYASFLIAFLFLLSQTAGFSASIVGEVWIDDTMDGLNLGTLKDPLHCTTADDFDYIMATHGGVIHLLPGTYYTEKGPGASTPWLVRSNMRVIGSGIDITTVKIVDPPPDGSWVVFQSDPNAQSNPDLAVTNSSVERLTIDCNGASPSTANLNGVHLYGSQNAIRRVKCINARGSYQWELFPLSLQGARNLVSVANVIEECEVTQCHGNNQISCITMGMSDLQDWSGYSSSGYMSGIIRKNRVADNPGAPHLEAYNLAQTRDFLLENNFSSGARTGFYQDWGSYTNAFIINNVFKNCTVGGCYINHTTRHLYNSAWGSGNYSFLFNTVEMTHDPSLLYFSVGMAFWSPSGVQALKSFLCLGNSVEFVTGSSFNYYYDFGASGMDGITAVQNTFDNQAVLGHMHQFTTGSAYNNFDFGGYVASSNAIPAEGNGWVPYPAGLPNEIEPANSVVRTAVTSASMTLTQTNRYVGVQGTGSTTLTLPTAVGYKGREIIVCKENSGANNVIVQALSGQVINNGLSGAGTISTAYTSKTFVSDGANWFAY